MSTGHSGHYLPCLIINVRKQFVRGGMNLSFYYERALGPLSFFIIQYPKPVIATFKHVIASFDHLYLTTLIT